MPLRIGATSRAVSDRTSAASVPTGTTPARVGVTTTRDGAALFRLPAYVATNADSVSTSYDIIYCDFDSVPVEAGLKALGVEGVAARRSVYRSGTNDTSVLLDYFAQQHVL